MSTIAFHNGTGCDALALVASVCDRWSWSLTLDVHRDAGVLVTIGGGAGTAGAIVTRLPLTRAAFALAHPVPVEVVPGHVSDVMSHAQALQREAAQADAERIAEGRGPCPDCGRSMGWDGHAYRPCGRGPRTGH